MILHFGYQQLVWFSAGSGSTGFLQLFYDYNSYLDNEVVVEVYKNQCLPEWNVIIIRKGINFINE